MLNIIKTIAASLARSIAQRLDPDIPVTTTPEFPQHQGVVVLPEEACSPLPLPKLTGHGLVGEGAPHSVKGYPFDTQMRSTSGVGAAKCRCGKISPVFSTRRERREWHRQHKLDVLKEMA